jgi:hypothetical protein
MGYYSGYGYEWSSVAASEALKSPFGWLRGPSLLQRYRDWQEEKRQHKRRKEQLPIRQAFFESLEGTEYHGTPLSSLGR